MSLRAMVKSTGAARLVRSHVARLAVGPADVASSGCKFPLMPSRHVALFTSVSGATHWRRFGALLEQHGFTVHNVHVVRAEDYRRTTGRLPRLLLRLRLYVEYCFTVAWFMRVGPGRTTSVNIVTTNPFFMPWFVNVLSRQPQRTNICLLWDLYPEALIASGMVKAGSLRARCVAAITRRALLDSGATVILGTGMRDYVQSLYPSVRRPTVIPVGADGSAFKRDPLPRWERGQPLTILYSGAMGHMHEIDTLVRYFQGPLPGAVRFRFHSTGVGYERLKAAIGSLPAVTTGQVTLAGTLDDADWTHEMLNAHIGLVTMAPGAERVVMPSKTYSAMAAGQAILAVCPPDADLAGVITKHDCGWVIPPDDVEGLARVIDQIGLDAPRLHVKRMRAYEAGQGPYETETVIEAWHELFRAMEHSAP